MVQPGSQHWLAETDLNALARSRFNGFFGKSAMPQSIAVARGEFACASLSASTETEQLESIRRAGKSAKLIMDGIAPLGAYASGLLGARLSRQGVTAIWLEDADGAWVAICKSGRWLSARSIPLRSMAGTSPSDIVLRECLANGVADPTHIFTAKIGGPSPKTWLQSFDDIGPLLMARHKAQAIRPNFSPRKCHLGLFAFSLAAVAMLGSVLAWRSLQANYAHELASQEQQELESQRLEADARRSREAFETSFRAALNAYRAQTAGWPDLMKVLIESGGEAVALTSLKAEVLEGSLSIEGEAKSFTDVQAFADQLATQPLLQSVRVTSLAPGEQGSGQARFALTAKWDPRQQRQKEQP